MIDFSCDKCGKLFHLKPEFAGRKTTCSGCKQPLIVPAVSPVAHAPSSPAVSPVAHAPGSPDVSMIVFSCTKCGMKFNVKAEFAGRATKCPTCKEMLTVPSPDQTQALSLPSGKLAGTASSLAQAGMDGGVTLADDGSADAGRDTLQHLMDGKANDGERYVIEGEIARGGMGAVLRAVDCDIRREVAVKYLLDQVDKKKKLRFVEEAQITGQLEHPNIVPIHELGVDSLKRVFFSMKMVKGRSLGQILNYLRTEPKQAAREYSLSKLLGIFNNICNGLAYAHSRGVVHRDIKPANIMVGDFGEVYVMDWGLAKVIKRGLTAVDGTVSESALADSSPTAASPFDFTTEAPIAAVMSATSASASGTSSSGQVVTSREMDADLTQEGAVMGTPVYMPPEQAAGKINEIDERSDIYAMGAILYEMLTLQPPISKEGGYWPVLMRVTQGKIDPPEVKAPDRARAGQIPPELAAVAMKALAKEKDDRYSTIEKLRSDIELFLEGRSVSAKEDTRKEMVIKFVKRNRAFSAVSASAAAVLLCVISWALVANFSERRKTQKAYDDYAKEQQLKEERTRKAVPALVEIARRDAEGRNFKKALEQVKLALEYDSKHDEARLLHAQLLIATKDFAAGSTELATYLNKKVGIRKAVELKKWCDKANADPKDHGAILQISQVLQDQKHPSMAEGFLSLYAKSGEEFRTELLNLYRKRIEIAWPGMGQHLSLDKDGNFFMNAHPGHAKDLSPLKDIPLRSLSVHGPQLHDLTALQGMPLNRVELFGCLELQNVHGLKGLELESFTAHECQKLSDLSGLSGMPLKSIRLTQTHGVANLSALAGMPLTSVSIAHCNALADLNGLKGLPLETLHLTHCPIRDLSPLKGLKLKDLYLNASGGLRDLTPLKGMPLTVLNISDCPIVQDLSPLEGMPLGHLDLMNCTEVRSLEPLRGLPLTSLSLKGCSLLPSLKGIEGMRLTSLDLTGCARISDISAVQNMPLININLGGCTAMTDLSPLKGKPFTQLDLSGFVKLTDLTPLKGMPLTQLKLNGCTELVDLSPLRGIPLHHLELSNCVKITDLTPLKESVIHSIFLHGCSGLKNLDGLQGQRFNKIELHGCTNLENLDGLKGVALHHFQMDNCPKIANLNILKAMPLVVCSISNCEGLTDISGLSGKRQFSNFGFHNCPNIEDWSPLKGVMVHDFAVSNCPKFHDLSPLGGMGGRSINITDCVKVVDLSPLKNVSTLTSLTLAGCKELTDLSPLKGLKLTGLNLDRTAVKDLTPLRGLPLDYISLSKCEDLRDLSPLEGIRLQQLNLPPRVTKGMEVLRQMKSINQIDGRPAQQFWQQWDASQPKAK